LIGRDLAESPSIVSTQLKALGAHDVRARLRELAGIPTLVMTAAGDPIAREETGRALAAAIPGALFELVKDAAHGLPIQHATMVNQRLERHWRSQQYLDAAQGGGRHY
jgi:pimeloyl-ACP methyl ester carboxylesterase